MWMYRVATAPSTAISTLVIISSVVSKRLSGFHKSALLFTLSNEFSSTIRLDDCGGGEDIKAEPLYMADGEAAYVNDTYNQVKWPL